MDAMEGIESIVSRSPAKTETGSQVNGVAPQTMSMGMNTSMKGSSGGMGMNMMNRRKRGRPRKYDLYRNMALSHSQGFSSTSSYFNPKRGRGRPRGSGKHQILSSLGELLGSTAGEDLTPHVVTINTGEDISARIFSCAQKGPRSICILSANGSVSNVTLRQPGSSGGILTFEGRFEILSLSGSFTITETGVMRSRSSGLSVSLASTDGRVIGGGVAGFLMAASPIQIVIGSFIPNSQKSHKKKKQAKSSIASSVAGPPDSVAAARPIPQGTLDEDTSVTRVPTLMAQGNGEAENSENSDVGMCEE